MQIPEPLLSSSQISRESSNNSTPQALWCSLLSAQQGTLINMQRDFTTQELCKCIDI